MRNQDNLSSLSRQEENKLSQSIAPEIIENPIKYFDSYTESELRATNYYVDCYSKGRPISHANSFVAARLGISPSSVKRTKSKLVADGFITSSRRTCFSRCVIKVSRFFLLPKMRSCLAYFLPALKMLPLISLLSVHLDALARKSIPSQIGYIPPRSRNFDPHTNIKDVNKDINYTLPSYVTNVPSQESSEPFSHSSQSVKKDCSMAGILARVCEKLSQEPSVKVEPSKSSTYRADQGKYRAMLEPEVFKIKEIPLTKWGQIRFCAFPAHIISQARLSFDKTLTGQAAFTSLFQQALLHCRKNNIEPDWKRVLYLATFFKQPDSARMVLTAPKPIDPYEDDTYVRRDAIKTPRPHKRTYGASMDNQQQPPNKRPEYLPWSESEKDKRVSKSVYIDYFTVEDGYKKSGNPLGFPNPYAKKYEQFLQEAIGSSTTNREDMETELYELYLAQKTNK